MIGHVQVLKSLLILKLWLSYGIRGQQWLFYFILVWQVFGLMNQRISQTERRTVAEAMQNQSFDDHGHTRREASQWWLFEYFPALECCTRGYPVNRPRDVWMTSSNGLSKWRCLVTELASPRNSDNLIPLLNLGEKWKKKTSNRSQSSIPIPPHAKKSPLPCVNQTWRAPGHSRTSCTSSLLEQ